MDFADVIKVPLKIGRLLWIIPMPSSNHTNLLKPESFLRLVAKRKVREIPSKRGIQRAATDLKMEGDT